MSFIGGRPDDERLRMMIIIIAALPSIASAVSPALLLRSATGRGSEMLAPFAAPPLAASPNGALLRQRFGGPFFRRLSAG